jgi:hypothetical protein
VLRDNRDSVMAMLEAFVFDPLISWRLLANREAIDAKQQVSAANNSTEQQYDTIKSPKDLQLTNSSSVAALLLDIDVTNTNANILSSNANANANANLGNILESIVPILSLTNNNVTPKTLSKMPSSSIARVSSLGDEEDPNVNQENLNARFYLFICFFEEIYFYVSFK